MPAPARKQAGGTAAMNAAIEAISARPRFQYVAAAILGIANASDATEVLCLGFVLDAIPASDASNDEKGELVSGLVGLPYIAPPL